MHAKALQLALAALVVGSAYGQVTPDWVPPAQRVDRTFHFANAPSPQGYKEAMTLMRLTLSVMDVSVDPDAATLSIHGTPGNAAMAEWLVQQLDQPAGLNPEAQKIRDMATHEYRTPGHNDDVVRAVYLSHTPTNAGLQELLATLRVVGDMPIVFNYTSPEMIVFRGTTAEAGMSSWLISQLDMVPGSQTAGAHVYKTGGSSTKPPNPDDVLRVFYPANRHTLQDLSAMMKAVRTDLRITKTFISSTEGAVVVRGTAAQISQADQLISTMDRPAGN